MNEGTLYIELFQPYAQYRNPFTFYYAQSYPLPPKSTIIGMLQNATNDWYGNKLGVDNWWNLKLSIHGGFESAFWNYQQLIKGDTELRKRGNIIEIWNKPKDKYLPLYGPVKSQRTPVYQQELFNGHLFIFVRGDEKLLEEIRDALEKPQKILYLGRSEDIVFIRKVELVSPKKIFEGDEKVSGDIRLHYPTYIRRELKENGDRKEFPIKSQKYPVYSIPVRVIFKNNGEPVKHKAEITKQTDREVDFETAIYTGTDYSIILKEPLERVEYFAIENGDKKRRFFIIDEYGWL